MIDWFDILVWRIMLPFTLAASLVYLIEVLPIRLAAVHRSWLWRAVYLKTIVAIFIPTSAMLMLPLPAWLNYRDAVSTSRLELSSKANDRAGAADSANLNTASRNSSSMDVSAVNSMDQPIANASVGRRWRDWGWAMGGWYLFGAWLTGVWLLSLLFVYRYGQLIVLLFQGSSKASVELMQMVSVTARQLGVSKPGAVILSPGVSGPLLMFAGRTTLVLPQDFEERYGSEGCRMAIAHELAHHRRGDLWWNIITAVVSIALFFWPPAWIAARRYYLAMEMACDNEAIRRARLSLVDYAELLVRLLDDRRDRGISAVSLSMAWAGSFRALSERIRFMKVDVQKFRVRQNFSMAMALLVLGVMAVPVTVGQEQEESKPKSTGSSKLDNSPKSLDKKEEKKSGGSTSSSSSAFSSGGGFSFGSSGGQGGTFFRSGGGSGGMAGGGVVVGGSASASSGTPDDQVPSESPGYRSGSTGSRSSGTKSGRSFASGGVTTSNGLTVTQNVEDVDGVSVKTTRIKDKKNDVTVVENEMDGITVTIRTPVKGKEDKVKTVKADDAEQLKKESAEAYRWYKKYASGPAGSVSIQNGGANAMAGGNAGGFAGGNAGGAAGGAAGGFGFPGNGAGNPAKAMMEQQIRQMMNETNDPVMKSQLQTVLDRMKESEQPQKEDEADDSL
jgi:beta-lactamase regulating signal transducer with metallopeptidase domain